MRFTHRRHINTCRVVVVVVPCSLDKLNNIILD
jgi:hypothetical protein